MNFCCSDVMKIIKIVGGIVCLIIGVVGLIFPIMPGLPFIALGGLLLLGHAGWQGFKQGAMKHCRWPWASKKAAPRKRVATSKMAPIGAKKAVAKPAAKTSTKKPSA
jgi:hypothetical protein